MSINVLQGTPREGLTPKTLGEHVTGLETRINDVKQDFLDTAFPIGFIYHTTNPTNPSEFFGGVWDRVPENYTLISSGDATPSHSETYRTTKDGAVFELIFHQHLNYGADNIAQSDSQKDLFTVSNVEHFYGGTNNCSYLKYLDDYYNQEGTIELLCSWEYSPTYKIEGRWIQGMKPNAAIGTPALNNMTHSGRRYSGTTEGVTSVEYGLYVPWEDDTNWKGFRKSGSSANAYISGRPTTSTWWYAIGQFVNGYQEDYGILGLDPSTYSCFRDVRLYARVDNLGLNFQTGDLYGSDAVTLAVNQIRTHRHSIGATKTLYSSSNKDAYDYGGGSNASGKYTAAAGGGGAHNNMQPFIKTYIWERIG